MRGETVTIKKAFKKEKVRKKSFKIYDLQGNPARVNKFEDVNVSNKTNDRYWNVKKYRMDILFRIRASYEKDGETFIFHYWINDLPCSYNRYSRSRGVAVYYTTYLFNIDHPYMFIRSIKEERIIIHDKKYLTPLRRQVYNDLSLETQSQSVKNLKDMI